MSSIDVNRMNIVCDMLRSVLILPVIEIAICYAMYSEEEKVRIVYASVGEELFYGNFWTHANDPNDDEWMGVCLNPKDKEVATLYNISGWEEGDQNIFALGFGNRYDAYVPTIRVSLHDLLPSNGLTNVTVPADFADILSQCRPQYVKKMQAAIDEI
jgi:hypothetical protein